MNIDQDGILEKFNNVTRPVIYFDNWTYDHFTKHKDDQKQFIKLMDQLNGTLVVSLYNFHEISRCKYDTDIDERKTLIDGIKSTFINDDPNEVFAAEERGNWITNIPCEPWGLPEKRFKEYLKVPGFKKTGKIGELIEEQKNYYRSYRKPQQYFNRANDYMEECRKNPRKIEKAKKELQNHKRWENLRKPCSKEILLYLSNFLVGEVQSSIEDKEWIDFFQLIVPVAYCDFVLLDKRWFNYISNSHLNKNVIAKIYWRNLVEKFLNDLKNFNQ